MQLKELKPNQEIEINGFDYIYKGKEMRFAGNAGTKECYIFYSEKLKSEKFFLCTANSKIKIKEKEGKLII